MIFAKRYGLYLIFVLCSLLALYTIFHGTILNDEGYILNSAQRLLDGQVMYRDFHYAYTPASAYITALIFSLFGATLFGERIGIVIVSVMTALLIYLLAKKITNKKEYLILPILAFLAWGPSHINFAWPVMYAIPVGFAICLSLIDALETRKKIYLFLSGFLTILLLLLKQNYGLGAIALGFSALLFYSPLRNFRSFFYYILGMFSLILIFTIHLHISGSLNAFLTDMYEYTYRRIIVEHALDTPFLYGGTLIQKITKAALYLSPLLISIAALLSVLKQKSNLLIIPALCIIFYILGIRPTTDFVHLVPLLAMSGLPLLTLVVQSNKKIRLPLVIVFIIFVLFGFYSAFFLGYYRWQKPLREHNTFLTTPKTYIWISPENAQELEKIQKVVTKFATNEKYIFVYDYQPMIYFLTDKKNPTKFDLISYHSFFLNNTPQIVKVLAYKKVKLIITTKDIYDDKTLLAKYIKTNYKRVSESKQFYFWSAI